MAARPENLVRLAEEVDAESWISNRTFERSLILGPAVILPAEKVIFERTGFQGTPDSMFIEIPVGKQVQGVVGLRDVKFVDCLFQDCAIIGTAEIVNQLRAALVPGFQAAQEPAAQASSES